MPNKFGYYVATASTNSFVNLDFSGDTAYDAAIISTNTATVFTTDNFDCSRLVSAVVTVRHIGPM